WLGEKSSVCTRVIERLYGNSHLPNDRGQYAYYGRVGGCLVTGNEDGIKHCAMNILYSLQHLGYVIPPQADAGWIGEAGPGPSYLDEGSGGPANDFTNRNTTFMTWNLLHVARAHVRSRAVAEEVVQEAWLGIIRGLDRFEGRSSLKTWILRIVVNTAKTRGVREARSLPFAALAPDQPAVDPDRFRGPED